MSQCYFIGSSELILPLPTKLKWSQIREFKHNKHEDVGMLPILSVSIIYNISIELNE